MKNRIALITCWDDKYEPLAEIAAPIMKSYCEKHGYAFEPYIYHTDPNHLLSYGDRGKIEQYKKLYDDYDFIMFLDIDAIIMNGATPIPTYSCNGKGEPVLLWSYDYNGPCSGFWVAPCRPMVKLFLHRVQHLAADTAVASISRVMEPPFRVRVDYEPYGTSDQTIMRQLMNLPPYRDYNYCASQGDTGHMYWNYEALGWKGYESLGEYRDGDWICTFPSVPLEERIRLMKEYAMKSSLT